MNKPVRPRHGETPAPSVRAIPTLRETSQRYAEMMDRREALAQMEREKTAEIAELFAELGKFRADPNRDAQDRAAALLEGLVPMAAVKLEEKRARLPVAQRELADIKEAIVLANKLLATERVRTSMVICETVRPAYAASIRAICVALIAAHEARKGYHALVDELDILDIRRGSLPAMPPSMLGAPREKGGRLARYLDEAAREGFIEWELIPPELRG